MEAWVVHVLGWVVSLAIAAYTVHFKAQVEKRTSDDERRLAAIETKAREQEEKARACEIAMATVKVELLAVRERHVDFKQEIDSKFATITDALSKLNDKLDRALEK